MFLQVPLGFTSQQFCWHLLPNLHRHVRAYTTAIWKVYHRRAHLEVNRWIQNAIHKLVLSKEFVEQLWREADDLPRRTRSYAPGFGWVQRERKSIINIILRQIAAGSKAMPSIRFNQNMSKLFHQNSTHMLHMGCLCSHNTIPCSKIVHPHRTTMESRIWTSPRALQ